jgi:hypothetical protein
VTTTENNTAGRNGFAAHQLRRLPGNGVLARYGELTLLCEAGPEQQDRVDALLDAMARAAAAEADGRALNRELAGLVSTAEPDGFPALCAFGPTGTGIAAVLHGDARLTVTAGGEEVRLAGRDAVTVIDRVITDAVGPIEVSLGDQEPLLLAPSAPGPETVAAPEDDPAVSPVLGVYCSKGHFNDPEVTYCSVCGISMTQCAHTPELGPRPQLGVLVLDDGSTYPLVRDHVVGRAPESDPAVTAGSACPVSLPDPLVSRLHARLLLRDWQIDLVDTGSANGTFVMPRGATSWVRSVPEQPTALKPGAAVAFGQRQARYYSYRAH